MNRYTENAIAKFDDLIRESDPPVQYQVAVDDLIVVTRTSDPDRFMSHTRYVDGETQKVTIKMYYGAGNRNEETVLWKNPPKQESQEVTLAGVQQQILAGIAAERQVWEFERAQETLAQLREELADNEQYIDKLEAELAEFRGKKLHIGNVNLLEILGVVAEGFVRRNPSILARIPGGEALAGAIVEDNNARQGDDYPETQEDEPQVTFRRAEAAPQAQMSQEDGAYLSLIRELRKQFGGDEFPRVVVILEEMIADRSLLTRVEHFIADCKPEQIN